MLGTKDRKKVDHILQIANEKKIFLKDNTNLCGKSFYDIIVKSEKSNKELSETLKAVLAPSYNKSQSGKRKASNFGNSFSSKRRKNSTDYARYTDYSKTSFKNKESGKQ